ncbi:hypothetical protein [Nannocystis pusilla]|uniref:Uncharacterized protein n=1 Tax=Nannocystis pusilla TaxID=889268 RepID=A0ABS7TMH1_9BACT|nr:hypothetical protein [Nannocystis pusilla]MBZ5709419.1 hypothetical protein [Nannocystis pusilla]
MLRRTAAAITLTALAACSGHAPAWADFAAHDAAHDSEMSVGTGSTTADPSTTDGSQGSATTDALPMTATGEPEDTATTGDPTSDGPTSSGSESLLQPRILEVGMPAIVHLAGPVDLQVSTRDASRVRVKLDGVELDELVDQGAGVFAGTVPCFGSVDNGAHTLDVIALNDSLADLRAIDFQVAAPPAGDLAWAVPYPIGSRARRIVVTAEGDAIEVGAIEVDGAPRPSIRKRSGKNGAEVWAEGTIVLDSREGSVDAAALTPDGRIWVAMNVRQADKAWRPRILLLDADGHETGIEMPTEAGATVGGIAADGAGGFFAVGFAGSGLGDMDVVIWRMNGEHVAVFSAKPWDYVPNGDKNLAHSFSDFAFDVVIKGAAAWVVGASAGKHEGNETQARGLLVPLDLETGAQFDPVIVQVPSGGWRQGMYLGAAAHPDGIAVVGYGATADSTSQRIEIAIYDASGSRIWFQPEAAADVAYGTAVAVNAHGGVIVTGVVRDKDVLRGVLLGRKSTLYDHKFPPSAEPSAALGLALDAWDQVFVIGEVTAGGMRHARVAFVRQ